MIKNSTIISLIMLFFVGSCNRPGSENGDSNETTLENEKKVVAYTFLLEKLQEDSVTLIVSENDDNLSLIQNIIQIKNLKLEVEDYNAIEKGPDLCYYSKSTKKLVAIINVTKRSEKSYYVSYYIGPEGGASKEIIIEKRNDKWTVINDDGMWNVK
jgi:hypothetical protein